MLSLKAHDTVITWPNDIAVFMMKHYEIFDIPFELQEKTPKND